MKAWQAFFINELVERQNHYYRGSGNRLLYADTNRDTAAKLRSAI
jgi:hypothetical protein